VPRIRWNRRHRVWAVVLVGGLCCAEAEAPESKAPERTAWVEIAGQLFELELALDPATRFRGLSGRRSLPRNGGMLFVDPQARRRAMVMRDCPIPLDVAFLDRSGVVVALHEMKVEPPRGRDEPASAYEARLPIYDSGVPAQFSVETAGGRLRELGVQVGDQLVFDTTHLLSRAR
jgi:uncharacterized membrane protein (UPF0127 family)